MASQSIGDLILSLPAPETGPVIASPNHDLPPSIPRYLVYPISLPFQQRDSDLARIRVIDFGQAFQFGKQHDIRCPLVYRAPETLLTSHWDYRVDIWTLACTVSQNHV